MPQVLENRVEKRVGLFDRMTSRSLRVIKSMDIRDLCPAKQGYKNSVRLEYTEDRDGVLFLVVDDSPRDRRAYSYSDRLASERSVLRACGAFELTANGLGLDPDTLWGHH
jgi:hypothetical protein